MSSKESVSIELVDRNRSYKGRLLGLLDDEEFHAMVMKKRIANKIFSGRTVPLDEIIDYYGKKLGDLRGLRLALAIRRIDGEKQGGKHLFITEKLQYITKQDSGEMCLLGEDDEYYVVRKEG